MSPAARKHRSRLLLSLLIVLVLLAALEGVVRLRQWMKYGTVGSFYAFELHEADMPPFGVVDHFEVETPPTVSMAPGDLYAVLSDGFFEAVNEDHELFGVERVQEVIRRHRDAPSAQLLEAIRAAVDDFAGSRPPDDDRTAVLIKSVPREAGA